MIHLQLDDMSLDEQAALNFGYSEQGMKDLDEVGDLVGGGDSSILALLRPYYSMVDMSATGTQRVINLTAKILLLLYYFVCTGYRLIFACASR
jgi:hypothetical protein